jgi:Salmonella virulence plasmid 65kDa B protein/FG-GAP-like repeat
MSGLIWRMSVGVLIRVLADARRSKALTFVSALVPLVLGIATQATAQTTAAGRVSGEATVSSAGAFVYELPIPVPAGIDGLQPTLSIQYDSQSGNGLLGKSFTLAGLSSVQRCPRLKRQDGDPRPVSLTSADRFCLDGKRLVLDGTAVSYGANGAVYRTEIDEFSKVTSGGVLGSGPQQFTVQTKFGLTHKYGVTTDSRLMLGKPNATGSAPTAAFLWSINETADLIGNTIAYQYLPDAGDGSQYIDKVTYNGGKSSIRFSYESDSAPIRRFIGGGMHSRTKLVNKIQTYSVSSTGTEQLVAEYRLAYLYGDLKGGQTNGSVAMLNTITQCGSDGATCMSPITFEWSRPQTADAGFQTSVRLMTSNDFASNPPNIAWFNDLMAPRRFVDLNKDGVLDILGFGSDGTYLAQSQLATLDTYPAQATKVLATFGHEQEGTYNASNGTKSPWHVIDMNRDGYPDIVVFSSAYNFNGNTSSVRGMWVSYWNPDTATYGTKVKIANGQFYTDQSLADSWGAPCAAGADMGAPRYMVDMNKDGYPDVIAMDDRGVWLSTWNGSTLTPAVSVTSTLKLQSTGSGFSTTNWLTGDCMGTDRQPLFVEDMNADGFPDIVGVGLDGVYLWLWNPSSSSFSAPTQVVTEFKSAYRNATLYPTQLIDMNGDGLPDLVNYSAAGVKVALWNGLSFNPSATWSTEFTVGSTTDLNKQPWRLVDVNADGFPDLVHFSTTGVRVALSDGVSRLLPATLWTSQFASQTTDANGNLWDTSLKNPRHVVDFDGDGTPDLIGFGSASVHWAKQKRDSGIRIVKATDSLGSTVGVQYTVAQIKSGFYSNTVPRRTWPERDGQGATIIVSELSRDTGTATPRLYRYKYQGRGFHFEDGPLGFYRVSERDQSTGIEKTTQFEQRFPFIGLVAVDETAKSEVDTSTIKRGCVSVSELCFRSTPVLSIQKVATRTLVNKELLLGAAGESTTGHQRRMVYTGQVTEEAWDLDLSKLPTRTTVDTYDEPALVAGAKQWGNRTQRVVSYTGGINTTTTDSYMPADEAAWKIGRLSKRVVESTRPARAVSVIAATADPELLPPSSQNLPAGVRFLLMDD